MEETARRQHVIHAKNDSSLLRQQHRIHANLCTAETPPKRFSTPPAHASFDLRTMHTCSQAIADSTIIASVWTLTLIISLDI